MDNHVSFGNIVFGLASAQHSTGFVGCAEVIRFLNSLENKVKEKIMFNINKSKYVIDNELFKKLKGSDIWEFRTKYSGSI